MLYIYNSSLTCTLLGVTYIVSIPYPYSWTIKTRYYQINILTIKQKMLLACIIAYVWTFKICSLRVSFSFSRGEDFREDSNDTTSFIERLETKSALSCGSRHPSGVIAVTCCTLWPRIRMLKEMSWANLNTFIYSYFKMILWLWFDFQIPGLNS